MAKKLTTKPTLLAAVIGLMFFPYAEASIVRSDVDYQYFRDFAENKGAFQIGASNIPVYDKNGKLLGTMLQNLPMPDFSAVERNIGVATLVAPQYLASVAHNTYYGTAEFGGQGNHSSVNQFVSQHADFHPFTYLITDRNNYPQGQALSFDYHAPRLHKLVTEVAPAAMTSAGLEEKTYTDSKRFPVFLRLGSGVQWTRDSNGTNTRIGDAYTYLTGGSTLKLSGSPKGWIDFSGSVYDTTYGPMATYSTPGDSGSPTFAYDTQEKRWVLVSSLNFYSGDNGTFNRTGVQRPSYVQEKQNEDIAAVIQNAKAGTVYKWTADGASGSLVSDASATVTPLYDAALSASDTYTSRPSLDAGKTLVFSGQSGVLLLKNSINQGAGALYFNNDFTVQAENDASWLGAGVSVAEGKRLNWQVDNPEGDRLSKLGAGTLYVNGTGINNGDISVGEGTVVLNQQADAQGNKQAFKNLGIVSGRATVVLGDAGQINPDNIYFGFRGGRLDVNGNSLTFSRIQNVDNGARISNRNPVDAAEITLTGLKAVRESDLNWGSWGKSGADIYEYKNNHAGGRKDYFVLKGSASAYYPTNQTSNSNWEYIGSDKNQAVQTVLDRMNQGRLNTAYNGVFGEDDAGIAIVGKEDLKWGAWRQKGADIYEYTNPYAGRVKEYFVLTGNPNGYYPTNQRSNGNWEYLGRDKEAAIRTVLQRKNSAAFGNTNGVLNLTYRPDLANARLLLSGGMNLNGSLNVEGGHVVLSGRPTAHAFDIQAGREVVLENDWINRSFIARDMNVSSGAALTVGRNVSEVRSDFTVQDAGILNLGYRQGQTEICERSDYSGITHCGVQTLAAETLSGLPQTQISGNIRLNGGSMLNLGRSVLTGKIHADPSSQTGMAADSRWLMTADSRLGSLNAEKGAEIVLNTAEAGNASEYHTLTIDGNLNGAVQFNYLTDLSQTAGDKVSINGLANGQHSLYVKDSGREPAKQSLVLLTLNHPQQSQQNVSFSLSNPNQAVDAGAYRYRLVKEGQTYSLGNPAVKPAGTAVQQTTAAKTTTVSAKNNAAVTTQSAQTANLAQANNMTLRTAAGNSEIAPDSAYTQEELALRNPATDETVDAGSYTQSEITSRYSNSALSDLSSYFNNQLDLAESIRSQLDAHGKKPQTFWVNGGIRKTDHRSDAYRPYKRQSSYQQAGIEGSITDYIQAGAVLSHLKSDDSFDGEGSGKQKLNAVTLFGKTQTESGWFASADATYGSSRHQVKAGLGDAAFSRSFASAGVDAGRQIDVGTAYIRPSVGVHYHHVSAADYELEGAVIRQDADSFVTYQAGVEAGKTFEVEGALLKPSVEIRHTRAADKHSEISVNDARFQQEISDRTAYRAGMELASEHWSMSVKAGVTDSRETNLQKHADLSLRYSW